MTVRYAVRADLARVLTGLRLTALAAGDTTVQDQSIEQGANLVDLYLSASSVPPFASLPVYGQEIIRDLTARAAAYYLAERLGAMTERVRQAVDDVRADLARIRSGEMSVGSVGATAAPARISVVSNDDDSTATQIFIRSKMGGW